MLTAKLTALVKEIYDLCGWSALLVIGGPTPAAGEKLTAKM